MSNVFISQLAAKNVDEFYKENRKYNKIFCIILIQGMLYNIKGYTFYVQLMFIISDDWYLNLVMSMLNIFMKQFL